MSRKCKFCGKDNAAHPELSFHRFPSDVEKRKIWACLLGWSSIRHLKKVFFICSDHFDPKDMVKRTNGTRYLKSDSNPLPQHSAFGNQLVSSSTASHSPPNPPENDYESRRSSTTLTASESENEMRTLELGEATSQNKTKNISNTGRPVETSLGSSLENQNNVHKKRKLEEPSADLDPVVATWCQLLAHKLQDMTKPTRESLMHKIDNLVYETVVNAIKVEPMEPLVDSSDQGTVVNDPQESHIKLTLDEDSIWTQTIKRECEEIELEEPKLMNLKAEPS